MEQFSEQCTTVCSVYREAPALEAIGTHVMSTDEKTGIQALERTITPMTPAQPERHDFEYVRHGTQCLTANLEVATGKVIALTIDGRRTVQDFVAHIERTMQTDPHGTLDIYC